MRGIPELGIDFLKFSEWYGDLIPFTKFPVSINPEL